MKQGIYLANSKYNRHPNKYEFFEYKLLNKTKNAILNINTYGLLYCNLLTVDMQYFMQVIYVEIPAKCLIVKAVNFIITHIFDYFMVTFGTTL
jgi:hypothetical protein